MATRNTPTTSRKETPRSSSSPQTFGEMIDSMTPEELSAWYDGDEGIFKMFEERKRRETARRALMEPERDYRTMTEAKAMRLIKKEHPIFVRDAKQIRKDFKANPDRFLKKAGAIKNPVVAFLSSLDSFD